MTGFMWTGAEGSEGVETCKKVLMNQQLPLTRAQHRHLPGEVYTHTNTRTHSSMHANTLFPTPLKPMSVRNRGDGWGESLQSEEGGRLSKKWTNKTPENQIPLLLSRRHSETLSVQVMWL